MRTIAELIVKLMKVHSYKDLIVWQKSISLVCMIYKVTENLPISEQYGLTSQIRRSAVSVPSNIAEGRSRGTRREFSRFLTISHGAAAELETQMEVAHRLFLKSNKDLNSIFKLINEIKAMLGAMIRKLNPLS